MIYNKNMNYKSSLNELKIESKDELNKPIKEQNFSWLNYLNQIHDRLNP